MPHHDLHPLAGSAARLLAEDIFCGGLHSDPVSGEVKWLGEAGPGRETQLSVTDGADSANSLVSSRSVNTRLLHRPVLTLGLPTRQPGTNQTFQSLFSRRLFWWPCGIPDFRRISIVSSRIGRKLHLQQRWFELLRTVVKQTYAAGYGLCIVEGTSAAAATVRAALLWKAPLLTAVLEDASDCMTQKQTEDWLCRRQTRSPDEFSEDHPQWTVRVSPPLCAPAHGECPESELSIPGIADLPGGAFNDLLLFALSEQIYVTHCRSKGTIEILLKHYLCDGRQQAVPCFLEEDVYRRIINGKGNASGTAVRWLVNDGADLVPPKPAETISILTSWPADKDRTSPDDRDSPLHQPSRWLLHWTRARYGPWPDQTAEDWLDELLRGDVSAARSDLITLAKIISDGILAGSKTGIRGGYRGVSFTEVPITEFRRRRIFRRHRNRFDFQPWGVAVRRDILSLHGIRPVIYGDDHDWKSMSKADSPWFQKRTTGDGATNNLAEQEWRLMGDLKLSELKPEDVCYFVDNETDAEFLRGKTASTVFVVP